jgi:hypothetical protein
MRQVLKTKADGGAQLLKSASALRSARGLLRMERSHSINPFDTEGFPRALSDIFRYTHWALVTVSATLAEAVVAKND